jgi:hypothetical protein
LDEQWLDNEANTVDEQQVLDTLESASDYEWGLECLDDGRKAIVKKLREWAGDLVNTHIEPHPTRCDILKAVSMISRYAEDLNYPIHCLQILSTLGLIQ